MPRRIASCPSRTGFLSEDDIDAHVRVAPHRRRVPFGDAFLFAQRLCFAAILWALPLTQCGGGPAAPTVRLNEEFVVAPGDTIKMESTSQRVRFGGVTSDSRCPIDVVCIQAGDAIVRIEILSSRRGESYDLHTADGRPVMDGRLTIVLVRLAPSPVSSRTIAPDDYRATLRATLSR